MKIGYNHFSFRNRRDKRERYAHEGGRKPPGFQEKMLEEKTLKIGPVTQEQIPYLKAAYAAKKPRLVYDDD